MLKLLIFMNIMGSLFFVLHMLTLPFEKRFMPPKYRVFLHRVNLLFFIIPFPACLFYIRRYFDIIVSEVPVVPFVYNGSHVIIHLEQNVVFMFPQLKHSHILIILAWIIVAIVKYIWFSAKNRKLREFNSFFSIFQQEEMAKCSIDAIGLAHTVLKELNLKKKPRIFLQEGIPSPHVTGVFRPTLCLPCHWDVPEHVYYMAIKHELAHLQHKDLLFQRISAIARIISWFNPLLYVMCYKMADCDELAADAFACKGESKDNCVAYQCAIIDLCKTYSNPYMPVKGFGSTENKTSLTKERIFTMHNKKLQKHKAVKLAATALMSVVMFSLSTVPALAYNLPSTIEMESLAMESIDKISINKPLSEDTINSVLTSTNPLESELYSLLNNVDFSISDWYYADENGNVFAYTPNATDPRIIPCNHDYYGVQISHHTKNSDGSCYVDYYTGKRCSKCGHVVETGHFARTTFDKCIH